MKIGIIGGYGHESFRILPGLELAWACDGYDDAALGRAAAFKCPQTYPDADRMLEEFRPDLVYIGSVYAHNGPLAIAMIERNLPVISEKPLATDRQTFERLRRLTADGKRRLIGEFTMRWHAAFEKAHALVHSGAIGEPVMIQAQKTYKFGESRPEFYRKRELFGGIIPWVASHAIDYARWCSGLRYESASAMQGNRCFPHYEGMEDYAAMMFQMEGGVPCVITADFLRPKGAPSHADDRLRITGTNGVVEVRNDEVILTGGEGEQKWICETGEEAAQRRAQDMIAAAMGALDRKIDTDDCLHVTEAALAARESAMEVQGKGVPGFSKSIGRH